MNQYDHADYAPTVLALASAVEKLGHAIYEVSREREEVDTEIWGAVLAISKKITALVADE